MQGAPSPILKCGPNLQGQPQSVDAIKYAGFNVCTLANNHILDQGGNCCLMTKQKLNDAGIQTVGAGENLRDAAQTLYLHKDGESVAIINCCEHEFSIATEKKAGANPLNPIQQYYAIKEARKNANCVIVIVHGGHEMFQLPSLRMKETYRFFIEAGADAVINHHQHCFSGFETYKGKTIFYGLGNLLFDHKTLRDSIWNEGYMVELTFDRQQMVKYKIIPYSQCNKEAAISLMESLQENLFQKKLLELNQIIENEELLTLELEKYYDRCAQTSMSIHFPHYGNKLLQCLYRLRLFPAHINRRRYTKLWNSIECESHREKQIFAFQKMADKY